MGLYSAAQMRQAAEYFEDVTREASDFIELEAVLDRRIVDARTKLDKCLAGRDSFDSLAYLRMVVSPSDFSMVRESETVIASSPAAQDVVALALLDMGLPRTPLTGQLGGQLDVWKVMSLAAEIVHAAQTRAFVQGRKTVQPLAELAAEFLAYELSVRGRQFVSVASDLNTDLFGDSGTSKLLHDTLGFTVDDVRRVRESSLNLLNARFFGARDRIGDTFMKGLTPDTDSFRADFNLMVNECRLYGAVSSVDVAAGAGMDANVARAVLDFFTVNRTVGDDTDTVMDFVRRGLPAPWGGIADGDEYLLLTGFLGEDEMRRNIERGLKGKRAWPKYNKRRAIHSESQTAAVLSRLLNGNAPRWQGQHYLGPVPGGDVAAFSAHKNVKEAEGRGWESDLLYVIDDVAVCVEVKAGSVTDKARGGNAQRLAADLEKTLSEGNDQADRLTQLIRTNGGVWDPHLNWIDLSSIEEVHTVIVMLDDLGPLSLSMNELASQNIINTDEVPWIVTLHDLTVISRVIEHPAQFLEYLRRRRGRRLATMVEGVDELDMFMWFLDDGMYFAPAPHDTAAQIPIDRPVSKSDQHRYNDQPKVRVGTLTDPLDAWMYATDGLSSADAPKPIRKEEPWVDEYLTVSAKAQSPGWFRFGADLVGLSGDAQAKLAKDLKAATGRAVGGDRERTVTTHGTGPAGPWLLTLAAAPADADTDHLLDYMADKHYQTHASRSMLLLYDTRGILQGSSYRRTPEERSPSRDAAVALSPLNSLAKTFSQAPPSARRATRQLRGKRPKKRR